MGLPMAQRLVGSGEDVIAYNRTREKLVPLSEQGVVIADTPAQVLDQSQVVILMLSNADAIREVLLSAETQPHLNGKTVIQMGTIGPDQSRTLHHDIQQVGGAYLEAPVLGSIPEAQNGTLLVMVGSSDDHYQQWQPLLQQFGEQPRHIGPVGTAAALKLALNQLIAALTSAFSLSLGFVQQHGVEVDVFMDILRQSALYAPTFDKKLQRMVDRNFANPNFPTKHLLKDTRLFLQEAAPTSLKTDSLTGIAALLEQACNMGLAETDYSAIFAAINPPTESA